MPIKSYFMLFTLPCREHQGMESRLNSVINLRPSYHLLPGSCILFFLQPVVRNADVACICSVTAVINDIYGITSQLQASPGEKKHKPSPPLGATQLIRTTSYPVRLLCQGMLHATYTSS